MATGLPTYDMNSHRWNASIYAVCDPYFRGIKRTSILAGAQLFLKSRFGTYARGTVYTRSVRSSQIEKPGQKRHARSDPGRNPERGLPILSSNNQNEYHKDIQVGNIHPSQRNRARPSHGRRRRWRFT